MSGEKDNQDQGGEVKDKQNAILNLFANIPNTIIIHEREFNIVPLSLAKIRLLSQRLENYGDLIHILSGQKHYDETGDERLLQELGKNLSDCIDDALEVFNVITQPNRDKPPYIKPLKPELKEWLEHNLDIIHIEQIILILVRQGSIVALLKKVLTPAEKKKTPTGEISSVGLSSSPAGE